jgi:hypothetical protein
MPTSLRTTLAAGAHPAEGQYLHEEQTLNKTKSLLQRAGILRQFQNRRSEFKTKVNFNKKQCIEAMLLIGIVCNLTPPK